MKQPLELRPGEPLQGDRAILCGCLVDVPLERLPEVLVHPEVDLVEWRIDLFAESHSWRGALDALAVLGCTPRHPVLATNRPKEQGGGFVGPEPLRMEALLRAAELGAEWVDVEDDVSDGALERLKSRSVRLLMSHHDFSGTPGASSLQSRLERMVKRGADGFKITTFANSPEDSLRVLELIPFGKRELGVDVIAFCMGPLGRWSRVAGLLLGSPWAYVQLPGQAGSASGQLSPAEMRRMWEWLR